MKYPRLRRGIIILCLAISISTKLASHHMPEKGTKTGNMGEMDLIEDLMDD